MSAGLRILVADDNVQVLHLVEAILRSAGYDVVACEGGVSAVEAARDQRFDLILLDGMMPDVDGFEACEIIRTFPRHTHTPVVFLTGMTDDGAFEDAIEVGADEVLAKPIRRSSLLLRVRSLLRVGQLLGAQERFQGELRSITESLGALAEPLERIREGVATLDAHPQLPADLVPRVADLLRAEREITDLAQGLSEVIDGVALVVPDSE
ncbi:MAG: response regulator [Deltaproteobacteria bacterium]|nr:response regulator [Deltaproteobacteria bacterium]